MNVGLRTLLPASWTEPTGKGEILLDYRTFGTQDVLCCDAIIEKTTAPKIQQVLDGLNKRILPLSVLKSVNLPYVEGGVIVVNANGEITPVEG